jgi:hypothetical protein
MQERTVVERAKGVIAYTGDLPMDAAYDRLIALGREAARPLTVVAATGVAQAVGPE